MHLFLKGIVSLFKMGRKKKDDIWGTIIGLVFGAVGLAILTEAMKPKCPKCDSKIRRGDPFCTTCGTLLEWR
jgi:hypothetical protein